MASFTPRSPATLDRSITWLACSAEQLAHGKHPTREQSRSQTWVESRQLVGAEIDTIEPAGIVWSSAAISNVSDGHRDAGSTGGTVSLKRKWHGVCDRRIPAILRRDA